MEIIVNKARAWEVYGTLLDAFDRGLPPYDDLSGLVYDKPKSVENGSREHAIGFFLSTLYMKGLINSNTAFKLLVKLHDRHHWLFDPFAFATLTDEEEAIAAEHIWFHLNTVGLGVNARQVSRHWVSNSKKLAEHWQGDPRLLFDSIGSYSEICEILIRNKKDEDPAHGFYGFKEKMVSMLTYFYDRFEIVSIDFPYPVPADFHVARIHVANEVVSVEGQAPGALFDYYDVADIARALSLEYCAVTGVDPKRLADALWHFSREFCVQHPGNSTSKGKYKARKTGVTLNPVNWSGTQWKAFFRTCARCPVESGCKWNIPSGNLYSHGKISVARERAHPLDFFWKK